MYEFTRGLLVWIAFGVLIIGSIIRIISIISQTKKDKVVLPYLSMKFGVRSIFHWIIPYGSVNMRKRPTFTLMSFLFHICLILVPIFTLGHVMSWEESYGFDFWHLPPALSLLMTLIVIITGIMYIARRIGDPTVRYVSSWKEYLLMALVLAPFVTGLLARFQVFDYRTIIIIHIWSGAIWLMAIPFTWLSHMLFFPFTRAYMGSEFGYVRSSRDW
ncbi:MAG: nitrate reductase [candidate division Zixibacteria bacterium]|nr:nitrate reductase [candidate division Zixibacteria bacterium]